MNDILDKLTFRFLLGQLIPGAFTVFMALAMDGVINHCQCADVLCVDVCLRSAWSATTGLDAILFIVSSIVIGVVLQGLSSISAANLESFKKFKLDEQNNWIVRDAIRPRTWMRRKIAIIWTEAPLILISLIAPLILTFDLLSLAASRPRDVYKESYIARSRADANLLNLAISDVQSSADYFSNMGIALLFSLLLQLFYLVTTRWAELIWLFVFTYAATSIHYVLFRTSKSSLDNIVMRNYGADQSMIEKAEWGGE